MKKLLFLTALPLVFTLSLGLAQAGPIGSLNTFTPSSTAKSAEVNANFNDVKTAVNANAVDIAALTDRIAFLENELNKANGILNRLTDLEALEARISALESGGTEDLSRYLSIDSSSGYATVVVSGANLQVKSGEVQGVRNGLGNIIIGDNASLTNSNAVAVCSDNNFTDSSSCISSSGIWGVNHKTGSHNLIIGTSNSYSGTGSIIAGRDNIVTATGSSITGGQLNSITADYALIAGGNRNKISGDASAIIGGEGNRIAAEYGTIAGGRDNAADITGCGGNCLYSTITGGEGNATSGFATTVSGGSNNTVSGSYAAINGGSGNNVALGSFSSTINGGRGNNIQSGTTGSTIGGTSGKSIGSANGDDAWRAGALSE